MKRFWFEDEGAVAVIVALSIFVLVAFTAVAVDVGYMYSEKRQLQTAADAGALAGCRVLADGGSNAAIDAEARAYATVNSVAPGDDLYVEDVEIGADYVQVTVGKDSPLFFAAVFGTDSSLIRANARANVAYLTGMRGIVPWAVPVVAEPTKVTATINGVTTELNPSGSVWSRTLSAPGTRSATGYRVDVTVHNSQTAYPDGTANGYPDGVPEVMSDAARVFVPPADCPITNVTLDDYVVTAGEDGSVELRVASPGATKVTARFNGKNLNLSYNDTTGLWGATLTVPTSEALVASYPINIESDKYSVDAAATLVVRRSTYPVIDVDVNDYVVGPGGAITVSVTLNTYTYGNLYALRVNGGGAEVGNFAAIDLSTIRHTPNWMNPQDPAEYDVTTDPNYKPPTYYCYLEQQFPFVIHLGDTVWTEPGVLSGPQSAAALTTRFGGDTRTFDQWVAAGRPASARVVYVPVVEKMQDVTGSTPLRVVNLAAFYVEPSSDVKKNDIVGRFIEYVAPSDAISEDPPGTLNVKTVHLVAPE